MNKYLVLLAALGLGAAAHAGDMDKKKAFTDLDANNDGLLTQEEASVEGKSHVDFSTADSNQDGYITAAEYDEAQSDEYMEEEDAE